MFFKKARQRRRFEKQLIKNFLEEHQDYIPKYSPSGMKLDWSIYVYKYGEHDIYTGEFLGEYRVGISQRQPPLLGEDCACYRYNVKTKRLEKTGLRWSH